MRSSAAPAIRIIKAIKIINRYSFPARHSAPRPVLCSPPALSRRRFPAVPPFASSVSRPPFLVVVASFVPLRRAVSRIVRCCRPGPDRAFFRSVPSHSAYASALLPAVRFPAVPRSLSFPVLRPSRGPAFRAAGAFLSGCIGRAGRPELPCGRSPAPVRGLPAVRGGRSRAFAGGAFLRSPRLPRTISSRFPEGTPPRNGGKTAGKQFLSRMARRGRKNRRTWSVRRRMPGIRHSEENGAGGCPTDFLNN